MKSKALGITVSTIMTIALVATFISFAHFDEGISIKADGTTTTEAGQWGTMGGDQGAVMGFHHCKADGTLDDSTVSGAYSLGDDFYFYINISGIPNEWFDKQIVKKISVDKINDDNDQGSFELKYYKNNAWQDASSFLSANIQSGPFYTYNQSTSQTRFKIRFLEEGEYKIEASVMAKDESFAQSVKPNYIGISNNQYAILKNKVKLDGDETKVNRHGSYKVPEDITYGCFDVNNNRMLKPGSVIENITEDIELKSVDSISVTTGPGASIKLDGTVNAIKFPTVVKIKNKKKRIVTSSVLPSGAIRVGTLLTAKDYYVSTFDYDLSLDNCSTQDPTGRYYYNVLNPVDNWATTVGKCFAGIIHISDANISREFVARGYAKIIYSDETNVCYSEDVATRSIRSVAQKIKDAGYSGLTSEQIEVVNSYLDN